MNRVIAIAGRLKHQNVEYSLYTRIFRFSKEEKLAYKFLKLVDEINEISPDRAKIILAPFIDFK